MIREGTRMFAVPVVILAMFASCGSGSGENADDTATDVPGDFGGQEVTCDISGENVCDDFTCCLIIDPEKGPGTAMESKQQCLDDGGKAQASFSACDDVCCEYDGGKRVVGVAACEALGGSQSPLAQCLQPCCFVDGDYVPSSEERCFAWGGLALPPGRCDKVCCDAGGEPFVASLGLCDDKGGKADHDASSCPADCCRRPDYFAPGNDLYELLPAQQCKEAEGEVVSDPGYCMERCCDLAWTYGTLPEGNCKDIVPMSKCDEVCCFTKGLLGTGWSTTTRGICGESQGKQAPASDCEYVCCDSGEGFRKMRKVECEEAGHTAGTSDKCAPICCEFSLGPKATFFEHMTEAECDAATAGSVSADASKCDEVCCIDGDKGQETTAGNCELAGGESADLEYCQDICCAYSWLGIGLYTVRWEESDLGTCLDDGGKEETQAWPCTSVCCEAKDGKFSWALAGNCEGQGDTIHEEPTDCEICCETPAPGGGSHFDVLGMGKCYGGGGKKEAWKLPWESSRCKEVCCLMKDGTDFMALLGNCEESGGAPAWDVNACNAACDDDGVCDDGEDDGNCPGDCGCSSPQWQGMCNFAYYKHNGMRFWGPAPAGCWCDDACQFRSKGCCADKVDVCGPKCGDGLCQSWFSLETCATCPQDCGACPSGVCGDGECSNATWENRISCPEDCGCGTNDQCGDNGYGFACGCDSALYTDQWPCPDVCTACKTCSTCGDGYCSQPSDEDCHTCPADCGACAMDWNCLAGETAADYLDSMAVPEPGKYSAYECIPWTCGTGKLSEYDWHDYTKLCDVNETAATCPLDCH